MTQSPNEYFNEIQSRLLFRSRKGHPYYITAPHWVHSSAGIRALYLLCDALNRLGYDAYITNQPYGEYHRFHPWTTDELMAPMLSRRRAEEHFRDGRTPITLYSEVVPGNPLDAPLVVRWVMNFPGLLGGDPTYHPSEMCFGYSEELADAADCSGQVLHVPTIDTRVFYPGADAKARRKGGCFFASKYKQIHGGNLLPITEGCFEITRQQEDSLSPKEIAELFRRSSVFYAYENTALATEAILCGCPAVFIPNPHLKAMIGQREIGTDGYAWGVEPEKVERARATTEQGAINYLKSYDIFWEQLQVFIGQTQARAEATPYARMIGIRSWPELPSPTEHMNQMLAGRARGGPRKGMKRYLHAFEKQVRPLVKRIGSTVARPLGILRVK